MNAQAKVAQLSIAKQSINIKEIGLFIGIPLLLMALLLIFEPVSIDLWIADHLYISGTGFIGKKSFFLKIFCMIALNKCSMWFPFWHW